MCRRASSDYNLVITAEGNSHILEESYDAITELENDDSQLFDLIMNIKPNEQPID
tara:strand:+ start:465 stop:629 length:165 start_codon:yes stop_codon:yes gene_type:complete